MGGGGERRGQKRRAPGGRMLNLESGLFHLTTCRINGCEFQLRSGGGGGGVNVMFKQECK